MEKADRPSSLCPPGCGGSKANKLGFFGKIAEDLCCAVERDPAATSKISVFLTYSGLHALWAHHFQHWLWKIGARGLARYLAQVTRFFTGVEIHPGASIGRRVFIDHGMGVVIGETAVIGDNVTIYHGVTLGGTGLEKVKRHPTLESCVVVGAGAKILGDITVGAHSRIGANAVVVKDVPPQSVVVGVPGQIIRRKQDVFGLATEFDHTSLPDALTSNLKEVMERLSHVEEQLLIKPHHIADMHLDEEDYWEYDNGVDYSI
jgi:serine O-acetyltransferase